LNGAHKLFQASIGLVMLAQDEVNSLAQKFIDEGESIEEKSRTRVNEFVETRRKESRETSKRVEEDLNKRMEQLLNRMNIPSRREIKDLNSKITRLTKKVDELAKEMA
jgi:poly(hydroxyalkanoate) granule-associated protein